MKETTILINYLSAVYELEKQCYVLGGLIQQEKNKSWPEIPMPPVVVPIPHTVFRKKSWAAHAFHSLWLSAFIAGVSFIPLFLFGGYFLDQRGMKVGAIAAVFFQVACVLGLLIFIGMLLLKFKTDREDREKYEREQQEIDKKNAKAAALYQQVLKARNQKVQQNKREQETSRRNLAFLERTLAEKKAFLQQYYDLDILYINYRGLARVSKYLEYLKSGRCDTMKEAYNLCATENFQEASIANQGIMIKQMSEIVHGLDGIRATNIMMYQAICSANESINRIQGGFEQQNQLLDGMQRNLTALENNSQATAYFSETAAKNSQLLAEYAGYHDFALRQKRLEDGHLY